jgi:hypothetical protein
LQRRMGYRVRPAWIWQRKRLGTSELIIGIANDGVAGIPGVLCLTLESADGRFRQSGSLMVAIRTAGKCGRLLSCCRMKWVARNSD